MMQRVEESLHGLGLPSTDPRRAIRVLMRARHTSQTRFSDALEETPVPRFRPTSRIPPCSPIPRPFVFQPSGDPDDRIERPPTVAPPLTPGTPAMPEPGPAPDGRPRRRRLPRAGRGRPRGRSTATRVGYHHRLGPARPSSASLPRWAPRRRRPRARCSGVGADPSASACGPAPTPVDRPGGGSRPEPRPPEPAHATRPESGPFGLGFGGGFPGFGSASATSPSPPSTARTSRSRPMTAGRAPSP